MKLPGIPERDKEFLGRMVEQMVVTFGGAFIGVLSTDGNLTHATVAAAVGAGLRAVYGYAVRWHGSGPNDPNLK